MLLFPPLGPIPLNEAQVTAISYLKFAQNLGLREAVTMRQGRCLLPADEAGRVLDRLLLLEQVIGPDGVQQALQDTGLF